MSNMVNFRLKDYNLKDTIAAVATFPSKSALGVIKISGKGAFKIISKIFMPKGKKDIRKVKTYTIHYGWIVDKRGMRDDPENIPRVSGQVGAGGRGTTPRIFREYRDRSGQADEGRPREYRGRRTRDEELYNRYDARCMTGIVDEVLVSVMKSPYSYTREDVVEISSHGGVFVLNKILEIVLKEGARLALPGEFTYRALIRGRIDLLQAQSISDIVEAQSHEGLKSAGLQLRGEVSLRIKAVKEEIKELFIQTEAFINFPDDEVEISLPIIKAKIKDIDKRVNRLLEGSRGARVLKEGIRGVICGRTNVGKSTLFNCLLREERVIVSEVPGTTRDVIEETIDIRGIPLRIYDTAGILEPQDLITKKAIEKSTQMLDEADLVILVLDGSKSLNKDDYFLLEKTKDKNTIFVINKIDLGQRINLKEISKIRDRNKKTDTFTPLEKTANFNPVRNPALPCTISNGVNRRPLPLETDGGFSPEAEKPLSAQAVRERNSLTGFSCTVRLSALKNTGLSELEKAVYKFVHKKGFSRQDIIFLSQYQSQRLKKVSEDIHQARGFLEKGYTLDFVNAALKDCLDNLGKLSGEIFSEEILEEIFSNFCIGK